MDVNQYLEIFIDEASEHLENLNTQIMNLEQDGENMDTINEIFRAAHSLKGMSGTMGFKRMQTLTHDMENVFSEVRNGTVKVTTEMIDVLFRCLDALEEYVTNIRETADEGENDNAPLIKAVNDFLEHAEGKDASAAASDDSKSSDEKPENSSGEAQTKEEPESGNGKHKWKDIKIGNVERSAIEDAVKEGLNAYGISVFVQESCLLKAARAFLVFRAMEDLGEVVLSVPSVQDIEDERFDKDFSVIYLTEESLEKVLSAIKEVSEIEDAVGDKIDFSEKADSEQEGSTSAENNAAHPGQDSQGAQAQSGAKTQSKPQGAGAGAKKAMGKPVVNRTVRVDIEKLDSLMNLVSELIISKNSLVSVAETEIGASSLAFNEQIEYLESVTTSLHESVMKVRMVPIDSVVTKFPRMIRDLSKKLDKKMELYRTGEDTELDRTVVDEIGDPLMHLLRNSADHGLESAEVRAKRGKPEVGSIFLDAYQDGNNVVIEVRDDGNGIDVEAVKKKAIEKGKIAEEQAEAMTEKKPSICCSSRVFPLRSRFRTFRAAASDWMLSKARLNPCPVKWKSARSSEKAVRLPFVCR